MTPSIGWNRGGERASRWGRSEFPFWPTQRPKTKHWWLLIWTSSAAKIKSQGPWLQRRGSACWGERRRFNKNGKAKWNPERLLLFICQTKSSTTVFFYIFREEFDECQLSSALPPHLCLIHSSSCPRSLCSPEWNWHLWKRAIRTEQCYGALYGHFIEPQRYFIDAWNNASAEPKQAIWKPGRN